MGKFIFNFACGLAVTSLKSGILLTFWNPIFVKVFHVSTISFMESFVLLSVISWVRFNGTDVKVLSTTTKPEEYTLPLAVVITLTAGWGILWLIARIGGVI